jgi:hypothetical protein
MKRREFLGLLGATLLTVPTPSKSQSSKPLVRAALANTPLRVVVVANKNYEADALMAVVSNNRARSPTLDTPREVDWPRKPPQQIVDIVRKPRCLIDVDVPARIPSATVEIWCLDDLMSLRPAHGATDNKGRALGIITKYGSAPDGVIAFGTAGFPGDSSNNGCATVGGTVFIHDAAGGQSTWTWTDHMEMLIPRKMSASFFSSVAADQDILKSINGDMLAVPVNPAAKLQLTLAADDVAISSVNIAPGTDFTAIDSKAIAAAQAAGATNITSVETTHGVIRAQWPDAPFIYVTAVPNRVGHFNEEASNNYAQNFAASHNAGIALNYLMSHFLSAARHS